MNPILKNVLVVIAGLFIGGLVNMGIVQLGPMISPLPEGVDMNNPQSIADNIHLFSTTNFIMTFLAHAIGTLVASFIIAKFAASQNFRLALIPGFFFLIGGIMMVQAIGGPDWFKGLDLLVAYLPMAYLGCMLGRKK